MREHANSAKESINMRGAYLEVLADTLGSLGVIGAAAIMWVTGWGWVDPVIGAVSRQYQLNDGDGRHVARFDLAVPEVKRGLIAGAGSTSPRWPR